MIRCWSFPIKCSAIDYLVSSEGHSCKTAPLEMPEDFRASIDDKEHCVAIAVDL